MRAPAKPTWRACNSSLRCVPRLGWAGRRPSAASQQRGHLQATRLQQRFCLLAAEGGDHQHRRRRVASTGALQPLQALDPVHAGHAPVQQQQLERAVGQVGACHRGQCRFPAGRHLGLEPE
jgi:hypothetical protein